MKFCAVDRLVVLCYLFSGGSVSSIAARTHRQMASDGVSEFLAHRGDGPRHVPLHRAESRVGGSLWVRQALVVEQSFF